MIWTTELTISKLDTLLIIKKNKDISWTFLAEIGPLSQKGSHPVTANYRSTRQLF